MNEGNSPSLEGVASRRDDGVAKIYKLRQLPHNPKLQERARELRKAGNLAEVLLWLELKGGKLDEMDFDRQRIIGNYIVDFFCNSRKLIIEIDGGSHDNKVEYDKVRDSYLNSLGLTVLHFTDKEVRENIDNVLIAISNF